MDTRQKKILVPTDFAEGAENALKIAKKFAVSHGSEIVLLHVIENPMPIAGFFTDENLTEKRKKMSIEKLEALVKANKDDVDISWMLLQGKPYKGILKASEEIMAEMIVMGIWGTHAEDFGMVGSNVGKVVRRAKCPVVTVTQEVPETALGRITIAVDPNFGIGELRAFLQQYHKAYNPIVELVTVAHKDNEAECEKHLAKQKATLQKQGIKHVETVVLKGYPISDILLDHIGQSNSEMIWMETHGRQGLFNFVMGSVTEEVLVYSPIPVLSLHPDREPVSNRRYYHPNLPI